jgi:plasmid maintenance system antidote protein VapI
MEAAIVGMTRSGATFDEISEIMGVTSTDIQTIINDKTNQNENNKARLERIEQ